LSSVKPLRARWARGRWRLPALAAGLLAAAGLFLALRPGLSPPGPPPLEPQGGNAPPVGRPAPDFTLPLLGGGTLNLHALRGKPVVLNFWASWCAPCREEMPLLVRLHRTYGPRGVQFVGIDAEDLPADARRFIAQYHVDYRIAQTSDERLMDAYAVPGLPTTVFIGADGIVVEKVVGGFTGSTGERALTKRLDMLLAAPRR